MLALPRLRCLAGHGVGGGVVVVGGVADVQRAWVQQPGAAAVPDLPQEPNPAGARLELFLLAGMLQGSVAGTQAAPRPPAQCVGSKGGGNVEWRARTRRQAQPTACLGPTNDATDDNKEYTPWPRYKFTGPLRPWPQTPRRTVPPYIQRPDYADTGACARVCVREARPATWSRSR